MDKTGELTGDDIAYIYPDMKMALKVRTQKNLTHNMISLSRADLRKES